MRAVVGRRDGTKWLALAARAWLGVGLLGVVWSRGGRRKKEAGMGCGAKQSREKEGGWAGWAQLGQGWGRNSRLTREGKEKEKKSKGSLGRLDFGSNLIFKVFILLFF